MLNTPVTPSARCLARAVRIAVLSMSLAVAGLAGAAEPAPQSYQLSPGPLGRTLSTIAVGAGLPLSFDPALTAGLQGPALQGNYTPRAAMEKLLAGSGLALVSRSDGTLTLHKQAAPSAAASTTAPTAPTIAIAGTTTLAQIEVHGLGEGGNGTPGKIRSSGATGLELSVRDTPQAMSVIGSQRIHDQGLETLQDVVGQTTGITLDHSSTTRETDQLFSRGFAVDTYLFDGIPTTRLVEPTGFDATIYERVEVVRGAAGLMGGTGSPAAAINLVRKRPSRDLRAEAALQAGSWDRYRAQADISASLSDDKSVRGRVVVAEQEQRSFIDRYRQDKDLFYAIVEADLGHSTLLSTGLSYQHERLNGASRRFIGFYSDGGQTNFPRSINSASQASFYDRKQSLSFVTLEHFFDNDWSTKLALNYAANQYDAEQGYAMRGQLDRQTGAGLSLWQTKWLSKPQQLSLDAYASGPLTAFGRQHDLVLGVSASNTKTSGPTFPSWTLPGYDAVVPNFHTWNGNSPTPNYNGTINGSSLEKERSLAGYGSLRLRPSDALSLILGMRVTNWKRDTESVADGAPTIRDSFTKNGKLTPYLGAVYALNPDWSAYASQTSIYSPQTYRDRSNALLPPLEGKNSELGIKGDFLNGLLSTSASVFHMRQNNLAEMDADEFLLPAGGGTYAYHTVQGATAQGVELEVSGQLRRGWQLSAGYARSRVEDSSGKRLQTSQPLNNLKLWSSYELPDVGNGLTVGGGVNWQGEVYTDGAGPNRERFTQRRYALVSLMARYRISGQLTAMLNVNNLLDQHYYASGSGGFYGDPRNVMLSLNYRFH